MKSTIFKTLLLITLAFFSFLMLKITLPYLAFEDHVAFLRIKQWIIHNEIWKMAFYIHVLSSCFVLLAGFTQFSRYILRNYKTLHRWAGRFYVIVVLLLSGPGGFIMALYANGGIPSRIAFLLLSVLWMWFTWQAYSTARNGNFTAHRKFMIRSFALTLSAITLRAWKYILAISLHPHPMDLYMIVAWLGWVPNLLLAELFLRDQLHFNLWTSSNTLTK
ncbi:MAG: DUF2306 domain-containing protein [Cytophagaceae bacterium]